MAIKIIENENGTVTEKTSKQITRERKLHKFQKAASVTAMTAAMLAASSLLLLLCPFLLQTAKTLHRPMSAPLL